jgi:hypothetical protein
MQRPAWLLALAIQSVSAPVPAAWRNVCPEAEVCSIASGSVNMNPNFVVSPASIPPIPFGEGVSLSLGLHGYNGSPPIAAGNNPVSKANTLIVGKQGASVPGWNGSAGLSASLARTDGTVLVVDPYGAKVLQPDGVGLAETSFSTSPDADLFQMHLVMPPVRTGSLIHIVKAPDLVTFKTLDEGLNWTFKSAMGLEPYSWAFGDPFGNGLWVPARAVGSGPFGLYGTQDDGASWQRIDDGISLAALGASLFHIATDPRAIAAGGGTVYGASDHGVVVSHDRGVSWALLHATGVAVNTVAVAYEGAVTLLLAGTATGVIASRDGGLSWSEFGRGLYALAHRVYFVNGLLLTGSAAGWYLCDDLACEGAHSAVPPAAQRGEVEVVEFQHATLDHYFITADTAEAAAVDAGWAGPGWTRTGYTFTAWTPLGNPIAKDVCRFYGSFSPGPNSHFFSASALECDQLHRLQKITPATERRLNFEALVFQAEALDAASGTCRTGTRPVYRAYNNGFTRGIDSSHRLVTKHSEITSLVARGWVDEGVAFCVKGE